MKKTKMTILLILIFILGFSTSALTNTMHGYFNDYPIVKVDVNGKIYSGDVPAILFHGNTFVPLRFVAEELGVEVDWDGKVQTAVVIVPDKESVVIQKTDEGYEWTKIETELYQVHYAKGLEEDAEKIHAFVYIAKEAMIKEFNEIDVLPILKDANVNIHLEPEPTENASENNWRIISGTDNPTGEFRSDIYLLTPSARERTCCTETGHPYDDKYLLKGVIHEFSTVVIQSLNRPSGWFLYDAPGWVHDGYEEYYGVIYSDSLDVLEIYKENARNNQSIRFAGNKIAIEDTENDGAVIIAFMYQMFGKQKMHNVLTSSEKTFEEAIEKELAPWDELEPMFKEWLDKQ